MEKHTPQPSKKGFYAAIAGTVLVALCCFTPILVITLGAVGLSAFTPYLDYVLLPALAALIVLTFVSYGRWKRACNSCAKEQVH
ncbi:MAG: mercury resistance system transport protein MerF [Desulfobacterales bacterium]|nr:mercury resistance system transport protein MerF [Desulfobacterales bacterium]